MPEKMTDDELKNLIAVEFEDAIGTTGSQLAQDRARAWDYYMQKPFGNEREGHSKVVTSDVADVIDGTMPSLMRIFATAENLVMMDPVGAEDVELAQQETDGLHHIFWKDNDGFQLLDTWMTDANMQRTGYVMCWWDESEHVTTETYNGLTDADRLGLFDEDEDEIELIESDTRFAEVPLEGGDLVEQEVHDIQIRRITKRGRIRIEAVPQNEMRVSKDANKVDPGSGRMAGREREVTKDELLSLGISREKIEQLPKGGQASESPEETARREPDEHDDDITIDDSQTKYLWREAYIKADYDGDGRAETRRVVTVNGELLENDPADRQPFHALCPQPLPHKHTGRSLADRAMDIQLIGSTLLRQGLDNVYRTNQPGHAVWEQGLGDTTMADLLAPEVGKVVTFSRPVAESYTPMTVPFTAGASFEFLNYFEKAKKDRTGISSDSEGLTPDALKNIQRSVLAAATDLARMKIELVARRFGEGGLKSLFLHMHELMIKHRPKKRMVQLRNEWIPIDPQAWRKRTDLTVTVGMGIGTRDQNLLHLEALWDKLRDIVQAGGGGSIVTAQNVINMIGEFVRNSGLKDPSLFVTEGGDFAAQNEGQQQLIEAQMALQGQQLRLEQSKHELAQNKALAEHSRDLQRIEIEREDQMTKFLAMQNDMVVKLEQIATQLTKLELESGQNVPGAKV